MLSPYVRRKRLGSELKALRAAAGVTLDKLAAQVDPSRQQISRYELGQIAPDLDDIMQILEVLGVEGKRWNELMTIAREAAERGWWESNSRSMGERQALFANLEAGAATIREYQQTVIPGLLQTPEFTQAGIESSPWPLTSGLTLEGVLKGRAGRQRMLNREGGPRYEALIDEYAIRRRSAPPEVLRGQLLHLVGVIDADGPTRVRVLPIEAEVGGFLPFSSFSLYTYPDSGDPMVVGIDAAFTDMVSTDGEQVGRYAATFEALNQVALPVESSREFLIRAADALPSR
ncbi:helix-turn-helix domain-containing protein [Actinomadura violacea]|uniref:Helix-turn-helix transcriptional regulator n=1 Tax=Actinomadura violacea TaxID=2819934 RepID=A0ABS3S7K5_9ACTN|nr:helix-turn-helix transcriptional regulator [Actinomadura violacea]MBO2464985.1 helix-turn-helix transcriptional regulator [Actinomadura violacea]